MCLEFERRQISSWKHFLPFNAECGQVKNRANSRDTLKNKDNIFSFSFSKATLIKNWFWRFLKPPLALKFSELIRIYLGKEALFIFQKCQVEIDFSKEDCAQLVINRLQSTYYANSKAHFLFRINRTLQ